MKRLLNIATIVVCGLSMMTACQKENLTGMPDGAIMLTTEGYHSDTKTSVQNYSVQWVGDGTESVVINGNPYTVYVTDNHAYIDGSGIPDGEIYGYYACGKVTNEGTTSPTVTVPSSYSSTYSGGRQVIALPMVAYSGSKGDAIQFQHVTAAVNVKVRNEITGKTLVIDRVTVSSTAYKLSGTAPVTLSANADPTVNAQGSGGSVSSVTVILNGSNRTITNGDILDVQVPILPIGNSGNLTVCIYAHDNDAVQYNYTNTVDASTLNGGLGLDRNVMLTAGCLVNTDNTTTESFSPLSTPLTFEARAAGVTVSNSSGYSYLQYSLDGESWIDYDYYGVTLSNVGDKVSFRARSTTQNQSFEYNSFTCTGNCYIYGNVMSLLSTDDFASATTLPVDNVFADLFGDNTNIDIHPSKDLVLPATTLTPYCYIHMFNGCSGLTRVPELPAENLASNCYNSMFYGCTSLTTAPALPAETLADFCYFYMFYDCSSLTLAPVLSATNLARGCCVDMFGDCTSLTTAPALLATTLVQDCYFQMFNGCTKLNSIRCLATSGINSNTSTSYWVYGVASTGTFIKASGVTWPSGDNGIPSGWTVSDAQ